MSCLTEAIEPVRSADQAAHAGNRGEALCRCLSTAFCRHDRDAGDLGADAKADAVDGHNGGFADKHRPAPQVAAAVPAWPRVRVCVAGTRARRVVSLLVLVRAPGAALLAAWFD